MSERTKTSIRSDVAQAAKLQKGAGIHKDRRLPRGGAKNEQRELLDEYFDILVEQETERLAQEEVEETLSDIGDCCQEIRRREYGSASLDDEEWDSFQIIEGGEDDDENPLDPDGL